MTSTDPRAEEVALALARVHLGLAGADTDDAVLRAAASVLAAYGPGVIRLYTLFGGESPVSAELASVWQAGVCPAEDPLLGRRFELADHPVLARWLASPERPLVLHDLAADPRPHVESRGPEGRGTQALVVLPLRDAEAGWLGALVFSWPIVHIPNPRERLVYDLLARAVSAALAGRQALRIHQQALDEANALYVASAALAGAADLEEILAALAEPAQVASAAWTSLWVAEDERLVRRAPAEEPAPTRKLAGLFERPNEPEIFDPVAEDMLDPAAAALGVRAALMLPLGWEGCRAALLELGWTEPRALPRELQRLYAAIAGRAAVLLSGRVLHAEARRALAAGAEPEGLAAAVVVSEGPASPRASAAAAALLERAGDELHALVHDALAAGGAARRELEVRIGAAPLAIEVFAAEGVAVLQDITAFKRAERERLLARGDLIRRQSALLARRELPPIFLSDELALLQLTSPVDAGRARQLAEVAASLGAGARAAIVDVSGATPGPAEIEELVELARTLEVRGIRPVFSGILLDPEVGGDLASFRNLAEALAATLFAPR